MNGLYDFGLNDALRKLFKPSKPVRHQQTCPICGRALVNTYRRDKEWKCLKCWETEERGINRETNRR